MSNSKAHGVLLRWQRKSLNICAKDWRRWGLSKIINQVEYYRMRYPHGTKLRLTEPIEDKFTPKETGDIFTVDFIDDAGQIHGSWVSGGSIAVIIGKDKFEVVTE